MSDDDKYPSDRAERFQVRLPPGLRDRIKAYAERHGRSMNSEIVRVLENQFPEQWAFDDRLEDLASKLSVLAVGGAGDTRIDQFIANFEETIEGIASGRVHGVDLETRERIVDLWKAYRERRDEEIYEAYSDAQPIYDDEEERAFKLTGKREKYAIPPPRRKEFHEMTEGEQQAYLKGLRDRRPNPNEEPPASGENPFEGI